MMNSRIFFYHKEIQEKVYELEDIEREIAIAINSLMDVIEILEEYI